MSPNNASPRSTLATALLRALNHGLSQADWARARLGAHTGQSFLLNATPVLEVLFCITEDGCLALAPAETTPDVRITLPAHALFAVPISGKAALLKTLYIEGNAAFADTVGFVLRNLEWDIEEDLSHLIGDAPAHRLVKQAKTFHAFNLNLMERVQANLQEFLTQEHPILLNRQTYAPFVEELASLQTRLDRLEHKLNLK